MARTAPGYAQRAGSTVTLESGQDGPLTRRTVLPGGLRVVTERVPGARSATVGMWVGVGSRDESPQLAGAAHYLEHVLFKGTSRRGAGDIAEEMDAVGGEFNAFTAKEHTCYYAQVLDSDLPLAVDMVTDVVLDAVCAQRDVDLERGVILDEISMRDDDPEDQLHEDFLGALLGGHALGKPVLGTESSVTAMSATSLRGFYRRRYTLDRMVLSVAGNIEHRQVLRLVRRALGRYGPGRRPERPPRQPRRGSARISADRPLVVRGDDTEQAHLMFGIRALDRHDPRRFALSVLDAALGGGTSSRLFQEVRERRGLAYQVYSSVAGYADAGHLAVYAGTSPERLGDVAKVLGEVLGALADDGPSAAEVARAKGQLRGGLVLGLEDSAARMVRIGKNELNYGTHFSVDETLRRIDAVTAEEVREVARSLLRTRRRNPTAAVVGPYRDEGELPPEVHEVINA